MAASIQHHRMCLWHLQAGRENAQAARWILLTVQSQVTHLVNSPAAGDSVRSWDRDPPWARGSALKSLAWIPWTIVNGVAKGQLLTYFRSG